jgi:hypothetical protein
MQYENPTLQGVTKSGEVHTIENDIRPLDRPLSLLELEVRAEACRRLSTTLMAFEDRNEMRALASDLELRAEMLRCEGLSRETSMLRLPLVCPGPA